MKLPRSVADVLDRHVTFELESIDRMYRNVYQPLLQYPRGRPGSSTSTAGTPSRPRR